jgi:hypothetical protein
MNKGSGRRFLDWILRGAVQFQRRFRRRAAAAFAPWNTG